MSTKRLRNSIQICLNELNSTEDKSSVINLMIKSMEIIRNSLDDEKTQELEDVSEENQYEFEEENLTEENLVEESLGAIDESIHEATEIQEEFVPSNPLRVIATVSKPMCEFDYQFVEFPDTACGSYSFANLRMTALTENTGNLSKKRREIADYKGSFSIVSDNPYFIIEPNCGVIKKGMVL